MSSRSADAVDLRVAVGRDRVLVGRDATDLGDLLGDLAGRQDAALAGLGALAELELDHPDLFVGGDALQAVVTQVAVLVAGAVFGGADLEDDVAAAAQVIGRQAAFAGVEPAVGELGALGQGLDGGHRQGAEAHGGDVDDRLGLIGLAAMGADGDGWCHAGFFIERRERAVDEDRRADRGQRAG